MSIVEPRKMASTNIKVSLMKHECAGKKSTVSIFLKGFTIGVLALGTFYFLLLFAITGDINHPLSQFMLFQPWMSLLIIGFGIQMGLFWMVRNRFISGRYIFE